MYYMPDVSSQWPSGQSNGSSYSETTKTSYGKRIVDSLKGILFGLVLFILSFVLLFWNEGRADLARLAVTAQRISADSIDSSVDGKFVAVQGVITADGILAEGKYFKPGHYLSVKRSAEMYSWVENSNIKTESKSGGSQENTTTYTYEKKWVNNPEDSKKFKVSVGHENPKMADKDGWIKATGASVGKYKLKINDLHLPEYKSILLDSENTELINGATLQDGYVFIGSGTNNLPQIGDIRINYSIIPGEVNGVVFGKAEVNKIVSYTDNKKGTLYRAFAGNADNAISELKSEHRLITWVLRVVGFLIMWLGLLIILGPVSIVMDVIPLFGKVTGSAVKLFTFIVASILSLVTIIFSLIFHKLIVVILACLIVLGIVVFLMKKKKREK